jgi:hypothetical protein
MGWQYLTATRRPRPGEVLLVWMRWSDGVVLLMRVVLLIVRLGMALWWCCHGVCADYLNLDAGGTVLQTQPRRRPLRLLHYSAVS